MTTQFDNLPTETEATKLEELFLAIYFNDFNKVIAFKNHFPEIYAKKNQFPIDSDLTFDLTNLTFFNKLIWIDRDWIKEIMPLVKKQRKRTKKMLDFWCAESGQQEINRKIEYNHYYNCFFCEDPNDYDEICLEPISTYLKKGFREIDLKLYNRVQSFDFVEVKKLLEQGAKSNIGFENGSDNDTYSRISTEVSYLASCMVIPEFEVFEKYFYHQNFEIRRLFGDILGLAAHIEMRNLLDEYDKEE